MGLIMDKQTEARMIPHRVDWADAYDECTRSHFQRLQNLLAPESESFALAFFREIVREDSGPALLERLNPQQFTELWRAQARHFRALISPSCTCSEHFELAREMGRTYALMGIEIASLVEGYGAYQKLLQDSLEVGHGDPPLIWAINRRLTLDLQAQTSSYRKAEEDRMQALTEIDRLATTTDGLTDLLGNTLLVLSGLDGMIGGFFSRPDAKGRMQIEVVGRGAIQGYVDAITRDEAPLFSISAADATGQGPAGRAWRNGQVTRSDNFEADATTQPWKSIATSLGIAASVAIPLLDEAGQSRALLSLYAGKPGYFSSMGQRTFAEHLQQVLSLATLRFQHRRTVPYTERRNYRTLLHERRVEMLYQPIIDLKTGKLRKVEALARLREADDSLISPSRFLPAFGNVDLLHLFEQGLEQTCAAIERWRGEGILVDVAINFPPQGITDSRYQDVLFGVMQSGGLDAKHLHLEILETEEYEDSGSRDQFLAQLRDRGIRLAQDDLGSGYSTLLRMDGFPFDEIKIDQGFVRGGLGHPAKGMEFVRHLTRLAHDVHMSVTVEGLETEGLVEAAAILGAESGQGYSIALPLFQRELLPWLEQFNFSVDPYRPRTALGALAGYLVWDRQLESLGRWPMLVEQFVNAPCAVGAFIEANKLDGPQLEDLLGRVHYMALQGYDDPGYVEAKRLLLNYLSERV